MSEKGLRWLVTAFVLLVVIVGGGGDGNRTAVFQINSQRVISNRYINHSNQINSRCRNLPIHVVIAPDAPKEYALCLLTLYVDTRDCEPVKHQGRAEFSTHIVSINVHMARLSAII